MCGGVKDAEAVAEDQKVFAKLTFDKGFKIVLGTEGRSEKILIPLLNRLLDLKIVDIQFLQTEKMGLTEEEEASVFDLYCRDEQGRRFLIEMQMCNQPHFNKRSGYYLSLAVLDQAREARKRMKEAGKKWDYDYEPVYVISFLNSRNDISENPDDVRVNPYVSHYITMSVATGKALGDGHNRVFIDLYRFRKGFDECENDLERWLFSIKNMHTLRDFPTGVDGTELKELYYEAKLAAWKPELRTKYERFMANKHDWDVSLQYEKELAREEGLAEGREEGLEIGKAEGMVKGLEEGRAKGRVEGRAEGRAEGRVEGRAEGRVEGRMEGIKENARKMKELGYDLLAIEQITGLSVEEIKGL